ncbi:MAG TPA: hypothetical protein VMB49_18580, partial [Acidobacteriaceae bacterium]|nr:hypothetical protein [Acidobacteriaceae bacterium]
VGTVPFYFLTTDTYSGQACSTNCTIAIPGISQRVVYYNVLYRNSSNAIVAQTGLQVALIP